MGGFTFNVSDMGAMMNAKDIITKKIVELVRTNPKVCYINSDGTGHSGPLREIYEEFPDRVLDVGIAEMNLVTVAAGLAMKGYIPFGQTFGHSYVFVLSTRFITTWHTMTCRFV